MANQSELKNFQRSLNEDDEKKGHYINAEVEDDTDDSEDEAIKIVAPRKPKKKSHVDTMLMEELITQQKAYLKAQKTIYKLRTEIDSEEVKTRYIKLDLNNAQVRITELSTQQQETLRKFYKLIAVNIVVFFLLLSIMFSRIL